MYGYNPNGNLRLSGQDMRNVVRENYVPSNGYYQRFKNYMGYGAVAMQGELFPHPPRIHDIKQSNIGNCYLLAALIAMLHTRQGQSYILSMMRVVGDRIIVKLYDSQLTPVFYSMPKIIYHYNNNGHRANWVYFFERAYAPVCRAGVVNLNTSLTAGHSYDSFKAIIGIKSNLYFENFETVNFINYSKKNRLYTVLTQDAHPERALTPELRLEYLAIFRVERLVTDYRNALRIALEPKIFCNYRDEMPNSYLDCINLFERNKVVRQEELVLALEKFSDECNFSAEVRKALLDYATRFPFIRGARDAAGLGKYLPSQLKHYTMIKEALQAGKFVCIGCDTDKKGLLGPHAYAVLNCYERDGIKYLLVCDPNKKFSRIYYFSDDRKRLKAVDSSGKILANLTGNEQAKCLSSQQKHDIKREAGFFELTLEDFSKNFSDIAIAKLP